MTLLDALTLAQAIRNTGIASHADRMRISTWLLATLCIDPPCGVEPFEIVNYVDGTDGPDGDPVTHHRITVGDTNWLKQGQQLTSDEARAHARLLLIAADECDEANGR